MLRSLWRPFDRFSLPNFEYIINELQQIEDIDMENMEVVADLLQSIVEIVTYGDKHDPSIFECFMDHQVLAEFVRVLKISRNPRVEAKVLQYLSILIQNLQSEYSLYYCLSNGYINSIISHEYEFHAGDIVSYYVSFLRAVSGRLNKDTICLLLIVKEGTVTSFPLYTEALRFAHHGEKMIQTAIRSLTLRIYNVNDDAVFQFLMTPPVSNYFSDLVLKLREESVHLDATVCSMGNNHTMDKRVELVSVTNRLLDDLYYVKDLLCVRKSRLSTFITDKLLDLLVVPIMISLMQLGKSNGVDMSEVSCLYFLSHLLQVLDNTEMFNSVACLILYPHVALNTLCTTRPDVDETHQVKVSSKIKQTICSILDSQKAHKEKKPECALEKKLFACHCTGFHLDAVKESNPVLSCIFSEKLGVLLASLILLLILSETDDLDNNLASIFGFPQKHAETDAAAASDLVHQSILIRCMPEILNALLSNLVTTAKSPGLQLLVGWFVVKLINLCRSIPRPQELYLHDARIRLNASFSQARERLVNEINGCWFDYIPGTFEKEWDSCTAALEESPKKKDLFFVLEIALDRQSSVGNDIDGWQGMVNAVKKFVLHLQLKARVLTGCAPNNPLRNSGGTSSSNTQNIRNSEASSAKFGSEFSLENGIPCKIAFSRVGIRDVYMVPAANGISGKLLLLGKHPFRSRCGIVFATAPLAGLTPKTDEAQATWLHLHIRDFAPNLLSTNSSNSCRDSRWTLGFSDAESCEAANLLIAQETCKQRSYVESLLAPFLDDKFLRE